MTVFDIGANRGDYSCLLSYLVGYFGKVYAFEPTSTMAAQIEATKEKYGINNLYPYQKAVYSENTFVELNQFPDDYSTWNSLGIPVMKDREGNLLPAPPLEKTETVEAITLDSFCQQQGIEKIDFLKVDV
jgi:FkbM family methyltransferase